MTAQLEDIEKDVLKGSYHDFEKQVVEEMRKVWESISAVDPLPPFDQQAFERRVFEIVFKAHAHHITETAAWNRGDYLLLSKQPFLFNGQKFQIEVQLELEEIDSSRHTFNRSVVIFVEVDTAHLNESIRRVLQASCENPKSAYDMSFVVNTQFIVRIPIKRRKESRK